MRFKDMEFEWDEGNSHKVRLRFSLEEVEAFFSQELLEIPDANHSHAEERIIGIGSGPGGKTMYVCFTIRGSKIRVISARYMRAREVRKYEIYKKS